MRVLSLRYKLWPALPRHFATIIRSGPDRVSLANLFLGESDDPEKKQFYYEMDTIVPSLVSDAPEDEKTSVALQRLQSGYDIYHRIKKKDPTFTIEQAKELIRNGHETYLQLKLRNPNITLQSAIELHRDQISLELYSHAISVGELRERITRMIRLGLIAETFLTKEIIPFWIHSLTKAIEKEKIACRQKKRGQGRAAYREYFVKVSSNCLCALTLSCLLDRLFVNPIAGIPFTTLSSELGRGVMRVATQGAGISAMMGQPVPRFSSIEKGFKDPKQFDQSAQVKLGARLIDLAIESCTVPSVRLRPEALTNTLDNDTLTDPIQPIQPTYLRTSPELVESILNEEELVDDESEDDGSNQEKFTDNEIPWVNKAFQIKMEVEYGKGKRKTRGMTKLTDEAIAFFENRFLLGLLPFPQPMLVPPRAWTTAYDGGYLITRSTIIRAHGAVIPDQESIERAPDVLNALNFIGRTPWKVNPWLYQIANGFWNSNANIASLPARLPLPIPPPPGEGLLGDAFRAYQRKVFRTQKHNANQHSLSCETEIKFGIANDFKDKSFYFPYNLDFRGRAYSLPPHLSPLGCDLSRGLLTFGEKKALGSNGFRWLKIHAANMYGKTKLSFEERLAWVDSQLEWIRKSVETPSSMQKFWLEAEYPWQFLAASKEIIDAMASNDSNNYFSDLPIQQDGSCNGLQHYAALGKDEKGGSAVNLTPADRPQDVYSRVCDHVIAAVEKDYQADKTHPYAKLYDKLNRKIVKQNVMTSVYGVTLIGARDQIYNRLVERDDIKALFPEDTLERELKKAAMYLAQKVLNGLGDIFSEAMGIMRWLTQCASIITKQGQFVSWTTPMGLQAVQPYRKTIRKSVVTSLQRVTLLDSENQPVHPGQQRRAFPPNFVHSLDATHMFLTALRCEREKIFFASVHDSYWTHAGDMTKLSRLLREEFVSLYSQDILEDLAVELRERYKKAIFPPLPPRGKLDIKQVLESNYFFS